MDVLYLNLLPSLFAWRKTCNFVECEQEVDGSLDAEVQSAGVLAYGVLLIIANVQRGFALRVIADRRLKNGEFEPKISLRLLTSTLCMGKIGVTLKQKGLCRAQVIGWRLSDTIRITHRRL